jgi:hypothetical protein
MKLRYRLMILLILFLTAIVPGPALALWTKYSATPSSNTAAPPDGAPEGMAANLVNNTMRDMMAEIRIAGDAIGGSSASWCGTFGGTANALTCTPSPAITAYAAGQKFRGLTATDTTSTATLAVSGLATKAIQNDGAALSASVKLDGGKIYEFTYDGTQFQADKVISPTGVYASTASPTFTGTLTTPNLTLSSVTGGVLRSSATGVVSAGTGYAVTLISATGTFTTPADSNALTLYRFRVVGAGGGSGGATNTSGATGGGASGSYAEGSFTGIAASTGVAITIGAGGTAGSNLGGTGGTGGATSIGSPVSVSCPGGLGGVGNGSGVTGIVAGGASPAACSGSPAISIVGAPGESGITVSGSFVHGGNGGDNPVGGGGIGSFSATTTSNGTASVGYGGGGGGADGISGAAAGIVGGTGVVIIERVTP